MPMNLFTCGRFKTGHPKTAKSRVTGSGFRNLKTLHLSSLRLLQFKELDER